MYKTRAISDKIEHLLRMFPVVAVIGPRQCGKSTLVQGLQSEWRYYDLESPDDYQLISSDPIAFFEMNREKVIIDEAQQYPELFQVLRGVIDRDRNKKGRFILTGSSSPDIVRGIKESLAGRIATVEMWPFKQGELYEREISPLYAKLTDGAAHLSSLLDLQPVVTLAQSMQIWYRGGFPEPLLALESSPEFYPQWMEQYIMDYIGRDIRSLFPRLQIHTFRQFLTLLAQFSGHQLNMSEMARSLEVTVPTVKEYLEIIHYTFLWRNLEPYTKNSLKRVQKSKKGFFRDQGVLHYFLKIRSLEELLIHPVAGFSFESFVIEEMIRGLQSTMATQLAYYYYRTADKSEVDLVIEGDFGLIPVEVKLSSTIKKGSLRGLKNFIADTGCSYGVVINRSKRIEQIDKQIIQIPVHYL